MADIVLQTDRRTVIDLQTIGKMTIGEGNVSREIEKLRCNCFHSVVILKRSLVGESLRTKGTFTDRVDNLNDIRKRVRTKFRSCS